MITTVIAVAFLLTPISAPRAVAEGPVSEGVPSFGESAGCGALDGVGGPRMPATGFQEDSTLVYGPWGDFFGRTIGEVRSQLEPIHLPGLSKTLYIHERVLPAFDQMLENLAAYQPDGESYEIRSDTWSFHPVTIPPTTKLSFHGIGAAIDVNSETNPYRSDNVLITDMPAWFVDAWRDAGWCWGGDWQTIKDAMHFSWMGPIHTPGYDMSAYPPQPPRVSYSNYSDSPSFPEVSYDAKFGGASNGALHFVVDLDADGAADVVRLRQGSGGTIVLEVSRARHAYTRSVDWATTTSAPTDPTAPVTLSDVTGDARPDLVYLLEQPDGTLWLEVFPLQQGGALSAVTIGTSVPATEGAVYLFDDFDMDGMSDLYVVRPGSPGTIEVWLGPGYGSPVVSVEADLPADSQYATGDRDFDGTADLYVLASDGGLRVMIGADPSFQAVGTIAATQMGLNPTGERFFVADLDGDGHPDLLLVDADGDLRMRRGGFSTHDPGIWFVVASEIISEIISDPPPPPTRVAGADRYETAVAASTSSHPDGADVVYVALGTNFPDAIAAGAAAAIENAPILLVQQTSLPTATRAELQRLDPSLVVVLGGTAAIAEAVVAELASSVPGAAVERRWGANRYATAVEMTRAVFVSGVHTVYVVSGENFADALVTVPAAVATGSPLLLTLSGSLPSEVRAEIERLDPSRIVIVGGTSAVSATVAQALQQIAPVERISASDRYGMSAAMSAWQYPGTVTTVYVAVGTQFPDALAAGPYTSTDPGPLLLVKTDVLPTAVAQELARLGPGRVVIMGGPAAVSDAVVDQIATYQK